MTDTSTDNMGLRLVEVEEIRERLTLALAAPDITHGLSRSLRATLKELDLFNNHAVSRSHRADPAVSLVRRRVQIGGGSHRVDGFFNIDIVPPADFIWDVREGLPLADSSAEFLFSEHFMEHIDYPRSVKHFVSEVHRVLMPGGQVVTGVPDAAIVLSGYEVGDVNLFVELRERWFGRRDCLDHFNTYIDLVNYVFRDQDDSSKYTPHLWAYDFAKLESLFSEAGFGTVEPWEFNPDFASPAREWGSVYVVATK